MFHYLVSCEEFQKLSSGVCNGNENGIVTSLYVLMRTNMTAKTELLRPQSNENVASGKPQATFYELLKRIVTP